MTGDLTGDLVVNQRRVLTAMLAMQRQSWEQGVAAQAALDLGRHDLARVMARDAVARQSAAGKLAEIDDQGLVNSAANAEVVRWAASSPETDSGTAAELTAAFERQLRWIQQDCPRAADGTLFHLAGGREVWVDTVYMVLPLLATVGDLDGAQRQLAGHRRRLFDASTGLYAARWNEDTDRLSLPNLWGTGNGWVAAGIARALRQLGTGAAPVGNAAIGDALVGTTSAGGTAIGGTSVGTTLVGGEFASSAAQHARAVIDACLRYRRPDGLFQNVLDDPASFVEANLAQMLAYSALTGVADGWLPAEYAETGRSLLASARKHLDPDGLVTGVCGAPHFDRLGTSVEAQAFFLLASCALQRVAA
jgi:unsaturated rhamnogalacturonyl hydrolase